jgi:hypothetical protein
MMRSYRFWFVAFASASVLVAAACTGEQGARVAAGFAGNTNGLRPEVYHATKLELGTLMKTASPNVTPAQYDQLRRHAHDADVHPGTDPKQEDVLVHEVIGCALRKGDGLPVSPPFGEGIMTPPADVPPPWEPVPTPWPGDITDGGKRVARMEDIHTCLIARLNVFADPVDIFLSGPHVKPAEPVGFPIKEAVWLATIDVGKSDAEDPSKIHLHVWPFPDFVKRFADARGGAATLDANAAHVDALNAFKRRICGTVDPTRCGLTGHRSSELTRDCEERTRSDGGVWWCRDPQVSCQGDCKNRPAIATHLSENGLKVLHQAYLSK